MPPITAASALPSLGLNRGPRIAVIYAVGAIVSGQSGYDPLNGAVVGSDTLNESIRAARKDSSVRAIVLRVDSPGGSATASDAVWRELMLAREKPSRSSSRCPISRPPAATTSRCPPMRSSRSPRR